MDSNDLYLIEENLDAVNKIETNVNKNRTISKSHEPIDELITKPTADEYLTHKIDRLCEFSLVLMHCILFKINYYNKIHFEKYLKYSIVVYVSKNSQKTIVNKSKYIYFKSKLEM